MKIIVPLFVIVLFSSCFFTSHVPVMSNQSMPSDKGEFQLSAAVGTDHIEGQYSSSVCQNFATYGGVYRGYRGINQYEAGGMIYTPSSKLKKAFLAIGGGYGHGEYKNFGLDMFSPNFFVNSTFNSWHAQYAAYFDLSAGKNSAKLGFCFKREMLHFVQYNITGIDHLNNNASIVLLSLTDTKATINTFYITLQGALGSNGFYFLAQLGVKWLYGFKSSRNQVLTNQTWFAAKQHPLISPTMLNISVGYKFNLYYEN